ncbi:MAG TPA: hypothetical protein VMY76_05420 [Gemmatimonadales bacterium]|nr:hypothetical protein [Gemmatimonadales bacterium]
MTNLRRPLLRFMACAAFTLASACGSDETVGGEDHTPVSYTVLVNGVESSSVLTLTEGQLVRVQFKFFNAADEDLDDVESSHFGGMAFAPTSLGTIVRVADHNFQFDVTGGTPGTGTAEVSYGHDEAADETTLSPLTVTVLAAP